MLLLGAGAVYELISGVVYKIIFKFNNVFSSNLIYWPLFAPCHSTAVHISTSSFPPSPLRGPCPVRGAILVVHVVSATIARLQFLPEWG